VYQENIPREEQSAEKSFTDFRFWILVLVTILLLSTGALVTISMRLKNRKERFRLWRREQTLAHEFAVQLANSELTALKAQMNPHFIFNSLNSINRYIIKSDPMTASAYLTRFSKLIRLILENSMTLKVQLAKELEAIELYLQMESMRFEQRFKYSIEIMPDVNTSAIHVFPLIMQPYVENAIWHGLMHKTDGERSISIKVEISGSSLVYTIEDNGIGRVQSLDRTSRRSKGKKSFGLQITNDRLKLLARDIQEEPASVNIADLIDVDSKPCGTRVTIKMPLTSNHGTDKGLRKNDLQDSDY
jgi:LytS/YehU family sensor histidine kinase